MERILIKLLQEEVARDGKKRRRGPKLSVFGRRKNVTLTLPEELIKRAKAMARVKRLSFSKLVEMLLVSQDEIYRIALASALRADERLRHSLGFLQMPGVSPEDFDLIEGAHKLEDK